MLFIFLRWFFNFRKLSKRKLLRENSKKIYKNLINKLKIKKIKKI